MHQSTGIHEQLDLVYRYNITNLSLLCTLTLAEHLTVLHMKSCLLVFMLMIFVVTCYTG